MQERQFSVFLFDGINSYHHKIRVLQVQ